MDRLIERNENFNEQEVNLNETLFCNGNGYIGVRGCYEEGVPLGWNTMRGMYINGAYEIIPMKQAESLCNLIEKKQTMLNVADTMTIKLSIYGDEEDGFCEREAFSLENGTAVSNKRILDMDRGITKRHVVYRTGSGKEVEINISRMASFADSSVFLMEYRVKALNFDGFITLDSYHIASVKNYSNPNDPRLADNAETLLFVDYMKWCDDMSVAKSHTKVSKIEISTAVGHRFSVPGKAEIGYEKTDTRAVYHLTARLKKNEEAVLYKYTAFADSIREKDPEEAAKECLKKVMARPEKEVYLEQKKYLGSFWEQSQMEVRSSSPEDDLNASINFNMYQLLQSAPRDEYASIAAKGLSGEGYEGHYFWDTEMYVAPFFMMTNPEFAKAILSYRYSTLEKARENAKLLGHESGALYPWRTITGEECSGYFPSGTAAYHINGDIAYTVVQYYLFTGDDDFILSKGAEIMLETARLWMDVGNYDRKGRFVINEVTGPDEYTCMVDNNYYTNCCASYNLEWAVKFAEIFAKNKKMKELLKRLGITSKELDKMREASEKMYLPYDEELGINPQDDSFLQKPIWNLEETPKDHFPLLLHYHPLKLYRYQVCKQADTVLSYFLFENKQSPEVMKRSFEYYEKITTHDSSLSTCAFSIVASRLSLRDKAAGYFGDSLKLDLMNTHNNTGDGVHTANMGGSYMAIVYGFAGLRVDENGMTFDPYLPKGIKSYSFRIMYKGKKYLISVDEDGYSKQEIGIA